MLHTVESGWSVRSDTNGLLTTSHFVILLGVGILGYLMIRYAIHGPRYDISRNSDSVIIDALLGNPITIHHDICLMINTKYT